MRVKLTEQEQRIRYELCPARKTYDILEEYWTPNLMFVQKSNFKSSVPYLDIEIKIFECAKRLGKK